MGENYPSVGIAILNWNGKKFLETLIPQLYQLTYSNYVIYLVDNKSSDDSIEFIKTHHPSVKLIVLDKNYGFSGGYNRGFAQINERYYLMLNSDIEMPPGFLEPLVKMMEEDENIAICQPKILSMLNKKMFEHGGAAGGMIDFLGYPFCRGRIFDTCEEDLNQYHTPAEIFWAAGACCLIRKEAYQQVNGLYEFFFMHSEEIDMCWRLIAKGFKIMYCPHSYIYHLGGGTLSYQSSRKLYLNFRNNIIMCFRNSPWHINLGLMPVRIMLDFAAALKFLLSGSIANFTATIKAYGGFLQWLLQERNKYPRKKKSLTSILPVLKKSIVWLYYIKKIKAYSRIQSHENIQ